jgi:hypothetical protein
MPSGTFENAIEYDALATERPGFPTPPLEFSWSDIAAMGGVLDDNHPQEASFTNQLSEMPNQAYPDSQLPSYNADSSLSVQCQCGQLVQQRLSHRQSSMEELSQFIDQNRKSKDLAQQVLDCKNCCDKHGPPSEVAGNVLLFGAVMMDIVSSYESFIADQKERVLMSPEEIHPTQIYIGSQSSSERLLELQLERQQSWPLFKVLLRTEVEQLVQLCDSFVARQERIHEDGHEGCCASRTCNKALPPPQGGLPANFCPRSVEPKRFFSCFQTSKLIQSLLEKIQNDLE